MILNFCSIHYREFIYPILKIKISHGKRQFTLKIYCHFCLSCALFLEETFSETFKIFEVNNFLCESRISSYAFLAIYPVIQFNGKQGMKIAGINVTSKEVLASIAVMVMTTKDTAVEKISRTIMVTVRDLRWTLFQATKWVMFA